jgi:dihydrofolate reductase
MIEKILIAAIDKNGGIGKDGYMPWHYPEDLKLFMRLTMGNTVVMGRKTFEGMFDRGHAPLKGRQNIIVTSQADEYRSRFADKYPASQLSFTTDIDCQDVELDPDAKIFYCGGANLYQQVIDRVKIDIMYLSRFEKSYDCDTFFPEDFYVDGMGFLPQIPDNLIQTSSEKILGQNSFTFETYTNKR